MFINNSQNNVHSTNGANFVQFPPNQPINNQGSKIVQISPSVSVAPPIPEEEPLFKCINDGYFEYSTGYFFTDKKNARKRFTDFIITKIKRCVKIGLNDCQEEFFTLNLKSENGFEDSVSIPTDKFADLFKEIEKNHHQFLIFTDRYSRANEFFKRVSKEILRRELSAGRVETDYIYSRWGWGLPFASGERKFFSDSPTEHSCPKLLTSLTDPMILFKKLLTLFRSPLTKISPNSSTSKLSVPVFPNLLFLTSIICLSTITFQIIFPKTFKTSTKLCSTSILLTNLTPFAMSTATTFFDKSSTRKLLLYSNTKQS